MKWCKWNKSFTYTTSFIAYYVGLPFYIFKIPQYIVFNPIFSYSVNFVENISPLCNSNYFIFLTLFDVYWHYLTFRELYRNFITFHFTFRKYRRNFITSFHIPWISWNFIYFSIFSYSVNIVEILLPFVCNSVNIVEINLHSFHIPQIS